MVGQTIEENTGGEVWDRLRSFRVDGHNVDLIHMPGTGFALIADTKDDPSLLSNPSRSVQAMLETVQ